MMRSLKEIAGDLAKARLEREAHKMRNVHGIYGDKLAAIYERSMELDRLIFRLEQERKEWVESV